MKLSCETVLNLYTHKNQKILCQIKVLPSKSKKLKNTCRCLTKEQWKAFDMELENLIGFTSSDEWDDNKLCKFNIKPNIEVKVKKSKLSLKTFYKCLGATGDKSKDSSDGTESENIKEFLFVLEFLLDYKQEANFCSPLESLEYEPQLQSSPDGKLCSPVTYQPYTPSKKKYRSDGVDTVKTPGIEFLKYESADDTYSPKPIIQPAISVETSAKKIPQYKPAPIKDTRKSRDSNKSIDSDHLNEIIINSEDENTSSEKHRIFISKSKKTNENEYIPKSKKTEIEGAPFYIPTPIEEIKTKKVINPDNDYKKTKIRSKTIDEIPKTLSDDTEKHKSVKPQLEDKEKSSRKLEYSQSDRGNKKLKNRSRSNTIDEIPASIFIANTKEHHSKKTNHDSKGKLCKNVEYPKIPLSKSKEKHNDCNKNTLPAKEKEQKKMRLHISSDDVDVDSKRSEKKSNDSENEFEDAIAEDRNIKLRKSNDDATDTSSTNEKRKVRSKDHMFTEVASLRRSTRSPTKPKRLIEEQETTNKKTKSKKSSPTNKDLFGTDEDDDDDDFENNNKTNEMRPIAFQTPKNKKFIECLSSSSTSASAKKKRKRDKSSECEQEKRDINKWLSKKKSTLNLETKASKETTKSHKSSVIKMSKKTKPVNKEDDDLNKKDDDPSKSATSTLANFDIPTKEEMEEIRHKVKLQQKENEKVKAVLDKIRPIEPKEVDILSLQNMSHTEVLDTFTTYKSDLDEIYAKNCKRDHISSHGDINHCFVIRLLEQNIQIKMLDKLTDVYGHANSSTQTTLFANALLPEWIIRVFMNKFNFNRQQAIEQIKAQEEYQLYMGDLTDGSFLFD